MGESDIYDSPYPAKKKIFFETNRNSDASHSPTVATSGICSLENLSVVAISTNSSIGDENYSEVFDKIEENIYDDPKQLLVIKKSSSLQSLKTDNFNHNKIIIKLIELCSKCLHFDYKWPNCWPNLCDIYISFQKIVEYPSVSSLPKYTEIYGSLHIIKNNWESTLNIINHFKTSFDVNFKPLSSPRQSLKVKNGYRRKSFNVKSSQLLKLPVTSFNEIYHKLRQNLCQNPNASLIPTIGVRKPIDTQTWSSLETHCQNFIQTLHKACHLILSKLILTGDNFNVIFPINKSKATKDEFSHPTFNGQNNLIYDSLIRIAETFLFDIKPNFDSMIAQYSNIQAIETTTSQSSHHMFNNIKHCIKLIINHIFLTISYLRLVILHNNNDKQDYIQQVSQKLITIYIICSHELNNFQQNSSQNLFNSNNLATENGISLRLSSNFEEVSNMMGQIAYAYTLLIKAFSFS